MAIRPPPGRAGRLWLLRRLELGRQGVEILDQKRSALQRERGRLAERLAAAEREWSASSRVAAEWNARARALVGERRLGLAALHRAGSANVSVEWANILGVAVPSSARLELPPAADLVSLGGGASPQLAYAAHARALEHAAAVAVARAAHEAVSAELAATSRRLRAIETRWIRDHEEALARLELALDEAERDDLTRTRWALERSGLASSEA